MLRINEIYTRPGEDDRVLREKAAQTLGVSEDDILSLEIVRESIDSRKKSDIKYVRSVEVETNLDEESIASRFESKKVCLTRRYAYVFPEVRRKSKYRPVVVGFGPAGMLCAYMLASQGFKPLVIERGEDVDARTKSVNDFFITRRLNTESNVQFGEGGAGTFSDGKLTTGIKDGRCGEVIRLLAEHGAPEDIKYSAKPHIGTDILPGVVKRIREHIIELGGEVIFGAKLTGIVKANGSVYGITYEKDGRTVDFETDAVALCVGHSARDTFRMLYDSGVNMEQKPFSVGARIEHPQELIGRGQYGDAFRFLPPADYKLSNHPPHGRGAYTFCMCPGGTVVTASSEDNMVVVNGMSPRARDGENANSAILVGVDSELFGSDHPLAGIEFQRKLERKAFELGGRDYTAPAQLVGDFLNGRASAKGGSVKPSCTTGVSYTSITRVLPHAVTIQIETAIRKWDGVIRGFALPDAVLTFPESRSSSPVRITRDNSYQSNIRGLYPCGEGAGYAGGIVSAAADGIRCAEAILTESDVSRH